MVARRRGNSRGEGVYWEAGVSSLNSLVGWLVVELRSEGIETGLLLSNGVCGRTQRFLFERAMHSFVAPSCSGCPAHAECQASATTWTGARAPRRLDWRTAWCECAPASRTYPLAVAPDGGRVRREAGAQ
jgi:hypothetical protein